MRKCARGAKQAEYEKCARVTKYAKLNLPIKISQPGFVSTDCHWISDVKEVAWIEERLLDS